MEIILKKYKKIITVIIFIIYIISSFAAATQDVSAATSKLSVQLKIGELIHYDSGRANTFYKTVTYKKNGKSVTRMAYCLEPKKDAPGAKKYTAKLMKNSNDMARVLYYVDDAPGYEQFKTWGNKNGLKKYLSTKHQRYAFMHIVLAYAYEGNEAFKIYGYSNKKLSSTYQDAVKRAYKYCNSNKIPQDASFKVVNGSSNSVKAVYDATIKKFTTKSTLFKVTGETNQSFDFTVPKYYTLYLKNKGKTSYSTHNAGKEVTIKSGASFYFECSASAKTITKTVTGNEGQLDAYSFDSSKNKQDMAFFSSGSDQKATFKVTIASIAQGKVEIKKATKSTGGEIKPESGAKFQIYNKTYGSYANALKQNTSTVKYAAEVTTNGDGIAISPNLYAGTSDPSNTYVIEQTYSKSGYKMAKSREIKLKSGKTVLSVDANQKFIINEQTPLKLRINKVNDENKAITDSPAEFKLYTDEKCTDEVETLTTGSDGMATSKTLEEGVYYIKETKAPDGYEINPEVRKVSLYYANEKVDTSDETYYHTETIEDHQTEKHDIFLFKEARGGLWTKINGKHQGTSEEIEKIKKESFTFNISLRNLKPGAEYKYKIYDFDEIAPGVDDDPLYYSFKEEHSFSASKDGTAEITISLSPKECDDSSITSNAKFYKMEAARVVGLPTGAEYQITEKGSSLGGNPYTASYSTDVSDEASDGTTSHASLATMVFSNLNGGDIEYDKRTGKPGQGVSTGWDKMTFADGNGYVQAYLFENSLETSNTLSISKEVAGSEANPDQNFKYRVDFWKEKSDGTKTAVYNPYPDWTVYEKGEDGKETVVKNNFEFYNSSTSYMNFTLKDNQRIEFTGVPAGVKYNVTESKSDYIPAYEKYVYAATDSCPASPTATSEEENEKANRDMTVDGEFNNEDTSVNHEVRFKNTLPEEEKYNTLRLKKITSDNNVEKDFTFGFSITGMTPNAWYSLILKGDTSKSATETTYQLIDNVSDTEALSLAVRNVQDAAEGYVKGLPVKLTRLIDDKAKTVSTGDDGILSLADYVDWIFGDTDITGKDTKTEYVDVEIEGKTATYAITYNGSANADAGEDIYELELASRTTLEFKCNSIMSRQANANGTLDYRRIYPYLMKSGMTAEIGRIPAGAKYSVYEYNPTGYTPSYQIERFNMTDSGNKHQTIDSGKGSQDETCETDTIAFKSDAAYLDVVTFTNSIESYNLEVRKRVQGGSSDKFPFRVDLTNAGNAPLYAVVPGQYSFSIDIDQVGTISAALTSSSTSGSSAGAKLSGVPIKITRPDGESIVKSFDENGTVSADEYMDWLIGDQTSTFDFTVDFLGTTVTMTLSQ